MTHEEFDRARELSDKIDSIKWSIREINFAFEKQDDTENPTGLKRMFLRFCNFNRFCAGDKNVMYVFFPEKLNGIEIDLDEEFVLCILDFLSRRLDKLEKEFSEIGID